MITPATTAAAALLIVSVPCLLAESEGEQYSSQAEEIQAEREKKKQTLTTETTTGTERALVAFKEKRILEKITYGVGGLRARIGALVTNSGFAAGPEYFRNDLRDGSLVFR